DGPDPGDQGLHRHRARRARLGSGRDRRGADPRAGRELRNRPGARHHAGAGLQGRLRAGGAGPGAAAAAAGAVRAGGAARVSARPSVILALVSLAGFAVLPLLGVDDYWIYTVTIGFYYALL